MVRHSLIDAKRRILVSAGDGDPPNENTTANQGDDIESNGRSHRLIEAKQSIHQSVEEATSDEDKHKETTAASNNVVNGHPLIEAKERIHSNRNLRHDEQNRSIISEEITTEDETITLPSSRHGSSATVQHGAVSVPGVAEGSVRRREPQVVQVSVDHEPSSNTLSASVVEELMIVEANPITFTPKRLRRIGIAMFAAVAALVIGMAILFSRQNKSPSVQEVTVEPPPVCTGIAGKPFETAAELASAVDLYLYQSTPSLTKQYGSCIEDWDVSLIESFERLFDPHRNETDICEFDCLTSTFNDDISRWNTSSAINMEFMFAHNIEFNQDLSRWDVSRATSLRGMFYMCSVFDGNVSTWDVSLAADTAFMFNKARMFNQPIGAWNTSSVLEMQFMFRGAWLFNQDISGWDVSSVTSMRAMFEETLSFNQDISGWDVSNVEEAWAMFYLAPLFNYSLANWNVRNMRNVEWMFLEASSFNQNLCEWLTKLPGDASTELMFYSSDCPQSGSTPNLLALPNLLDDVREGPMCHECEPPPNRPVCSNISGKPFETTQELYDAVDLYLLVNSSLTKDYGSCIGDWDVSRISDFDRVFDRNRFVSSTPCVIGNCLSFYLDEDLSRWNTTSATSMEYMFAHARHFNSPLGAWDVSGVSSMAGMFLFATSFDQPLANWDVSKATFMDGMFAYALEFNQDLSSWDVSSVNAMSYMFLDAHSFNQNICDWLDRLPSDVESSGMFDNTFSCPSSEAPVLGLAEQSPMCHFCE